MCSLWHIRDTLHSFLLLFIRFFFLLLFISAWSAWTLPTAFTRFYLTIWSFAALRLLLAGFDFVSHSEQNQLPSESKINRTPSFPQGDGEGISAKMTRQLWKMLSLDWLCMQQQCHEIFPFNLSFYTVLYRSTSFIGNSNSKIWNSIGVAKIVVSPPPAERSCRIVYNRV